MENTSYKKIVEKLTPFFGSVNLKKVESDDGEIFINDSKAVKIAYNETKGLVTLSVADVVEKGTGDFSVLSSWLFDDNSNDKDINSIANDFEDSVRGVLGCREAAPKRSIGMPKSSAGDSKTPEDVAQKILSVFPSLKNVYTEHMLENNEFYYVEFFENCVVPEICKLLDAGDKKKISKFLASLNEMYIDGTQETTAVIAYTLLGGVGAVDSKYKDILNTYIADFQYLKLVMPHVFALAEMDAKKNK